MSSSSKSSVHDPRVRFNWGFHDAMDDASRQRVARNVDRHFDKVYAAGYTAAQREFRATRIRAESSDPAWLEHIATKS
jgi:hypothetical protein